MEDVLGSNWLWGDRGKKRVPVGRTIRNELLKMSKGHCMQCNRNLFEIGIPEVHHKNGNPSDNKLSNLMVICSICHSEYTHNQRLQKILKSAKERKQREEDPLGLSSMPKINLGLPKISTKNPIGLDVESDLFGTPKQKKSKKKKQEEFSLW